MPVPETSVNKDNLSAAWKNEIRLPRQARVVEPVSVTERMDKLSYGEFWAGVATAHASQPIAVMRSRRSPLAAPLTG